MKKQVQNSPKIFFSDQRRIQLQMWAERRGLNFGSSNAFGLRKTAKTYAAKESAKKEKTEIDEIKKESKEREIREKEKQKTGGSS